MTHYIAWKISNVSVGLHSLSSSLYWDYGVGKRLPYTSTFVHGMLLSTRLRIPAVTLPGPSS